MAHVMVASSSFEFDTMVWKVQGPRLCNKRIDVLLFDRAAVLFDSSYVKAIDSAFLLAVSWLF